MRNTGTILGPVISEKSFKLAASGQYTFCVDVAATAADVAHAIEAMYKVNVVSVRTLNMDGKIKRYKGYSGSRSDWKKAIFTLKAGQRIAGFEVPAEEPVKEDKKAETKKLPKATKSDVKTTVRTPKAKPAAEKPAKENA